MKANTRLVKITILIVALLLGGFILYGIAANVKNTQLREQAGVKQTVPVAVETIGVSSFAERVVVKGNIEARDKALVPARIPGTIEAIFVDEGDVVAAGETRLFQIDALKLEKAVEVQKQAHAVAQCAMLEKETRLEQVEANLEKAKTDYMRFKRLVDEKAVSQDGFEQMALQYKQAQVALKHIKTLIDLAKEQKRQAQAALDIAEKDLKDSLVLAPISGNVVFRLKEPGEMAGPGEPVLKIENRKIIEAVAFLPAHYYGDIFSGKTEVRLKTCGRKIDKCIIDYKSPTINEKLRSFTVKTIIETPPDGFVPGAMVEMEILLRRQKGLAVPSTAIQVRNGRSVIFVVKEDRARMIEVITGIEDNGRTLISSSDAIDGASVVVQGQFLLDEGTAVVVQKGVG